MKTIKEYYGGFSDAVIDKMAGEMQRAEMENAFRAGCHAMLMATNELAYLEGEEAVAYLEDLHTENLQWMADFKAKHRIG